MKLERVYIDEKNNRVFRKIEGYGEHGIPELVRDITSENIYDSLLYFDTPMVKTDGILGKRLGYCLTLTPTGACPSQYIFCCIHVCMCLMAAAGTFKLDTTSVLLCPMTTSSAFL